MRFEGYPAGDFWLGLAADNAKPWFEAHRDRFDAEVREPTAALLAELPSRFQPFHTFRIHRDVRFSHDKSPYKLQHGAMHEDDGGVDYLHHDADGLLVANGMYQFTPDQLVRYRAAVDDGRSGGSLVRLLAGAGRRGLTVGTGGPDPLTTAPRGYPADHDRIELLRHRGLVTSAQLPTEELGDADAVRDFVISTFDASRPLKRWLSRHVGPPEHRPEPGA